MADYPDGSNFEDTPQHPHTDLFRDIPISGRWITIRDAKTGQRTKVWRVGARGVITLPSTASRIAEHAELCGFRLHPELALIKRVDPIRGGKSITNPGDWMDINAPDPDPDPVHVVAAQAEQLMPSELLELRRRIDEQLGGYA
ncbi:phage gene 29 protein family protein [Nocardia sp. CA-290969]|uniref:phage gene 29 protein family protein n=1 Tax=Nocardia sp. CA-290969 TaxID=3239986 RepID=UPI003D90AA17